jgi:NADPH:quinone reductase-like Zn-dependent oxidoreductase
MSDVNGLPQMAGPTESAPEEGTIGVRAGAHTVDISAVEHWVDEGLHIFRSSEFDCMSEAEGETEAVAAFVAMAEDLFRFLEDLLDAGRATEEEKLILIKLSRRFFEIYQAAQLDQEEQQKPWLRQLVRRLGQQPVRSQPEWHRQPATRADYSQLSPA